MKNTTRTLDWSATYSSPADSARAVGVKEAKGGERRAVVVPLELCRTTRWCAKSDMNTAPLALSTVTPVTRKALNHRSTCCTATVAFRAPTGWTAEHSRTSAGKRRTRRRRSSSGGRGGVMLGR